jgi:hypothetical protein
VLVQFRQAITVAHKRVEARTSGATAIDRHSLIAKKEQRTAHPSGLDRPYMSL